MSIDRDITAANDLTTSLLNPSSVSQLEPMDDATQYYLMTLSRLFGNHIIKDTYTRLLKPNLRVQFPPIPQLQPLPRNVIPSPQPLIPPSLSPPLQLKINNPPQRYCFNIPHRIYPYLIYLKQ